MLLQWTRRFAFCFISDVIGGAPLSSRVGQYPLGAILRAYKLTIGVLGAFLTTVAASVSADYLAIVLFQCGSVQ